LAGMHEPTAGKQQYEQDHSRQNRIGFVAKIVAYSHGVPPYLFA